VSTIAGPQTTRSIWANRPFLRYWTGHGASQLGDEVSAIAVPFTAATMLDASPSQVGVLTAAFWVPALFSLPVGTWVDGHPHHRRLLVTANLVQCAAVLSVPVAYLLGGLSVTLLCVAALGLGAGGVLYYTTYPGFFARLVPRTQYVPANSLLSTTKSLADLTGRAVGGLLIRAVTAPIAMLVDAVSFLVSALLIRTVRLEHAPPGGLEPEAEPRAETFAQRMRVGVGYLRAHPYLRASMTCSTILNFASFVAQALLVLYATRQLGLGAGQLGAALAVGALGGLVGAAVAGAVARRIGTGPTIATGAVLNTLPLAALPLAEGGEARAMLVLAAVELVAGIGVMLYDVNNNAVRAAVTRDDMRSRVSGAYSTINYGIRPLGALAGGFLAEAVGIPVTLVVAGVLGSLAVLPLLRSPVLTVRSVDDL